MAYLTKFFTIFFITDNSCQHTLSTIYDWEVLLVLYFILFFTFFQTQLLAYNLEKGLHLVVIPRIITRQLTHGCKHLILAYWTALRLVAKSKSMFSLLLQVNIPNNQGQSTTNPAFTITKRGNIPNIHNIQNFSHLSNSFTYRIEAKPEYSVTGHQHYSKFLK